MNEDNSIRVYYRNEDNKMSEILNKMPSLSGEYMPTVYMRHSFLQAVYNTKVNKQIKIDFTREYLKMQDGGQISLDWALPLQNIQQQQQYQQYEPEASRKIMVVLHGLTGGSDKNYIRELIQLGQLRGYRCVVYHNRGVNNTKLLTPVPYDGSSLNDVQTALEYIQYKYPNACIYGVGTSFGGNQLLRYLINNKLKSNVFTACVTLSAPFDFNACLLEVGGSIYEKYLIKGMINQIILSNLDILSILEKTHNVDFTKIQNTRNIIDIYEYLFAKVFGFKNAHEYIQTATIHNSMIQDINIPVLMLHSKDDPISIIHTVPKNTLTHNPNLIFAETNHGGHLCWFTGFIPSRWYPIPTLEFFEAFESYQKSHSNKA